jgi:hypothetical protein
LNQASDRSKRPAASGDTKIAPSDALRQAMMGLLDSQGFADGSGKSLFTYGHPLFWAPIPVRNCEHRLLRLGSAIVRAVSARAIQCAGLSRVIVTRRKIAFKQTWSILNRLMSAA